MKNYISTTNNITPSFSYIETFVKIKRFGTIGPNQLGFQEITQKVSDRDPSKVLKKVAGIISFSFFDQQTVDGKLEITNQSAEYIPGGKILTRKEIEADPDSEQILMDMIDGNWEKVIIAGFVYHEYVDGKFIVI